MEENIMEFFAKEESLKFTEPMKEFLLEKLEKLSKYVSSLDGRTVLKKEGNLIKIEITLPGNIRSSASHSDYYEAVLIVVDQLHTQLNKYKDIHKLNKRKTKLSSNIAEYFPEELESSIGEYNIIDKHIPAEKMYKEDAVEKMELLGHTFFAFVDIESNNMCVVYKRFDGQYGCLVLS
jgi:putative sigma-54 modulation protein